MHNVLCDQFRLFCSERRHGFDQQKAKYIYIFEKEDNRGENCANMLKLLLSHFRAFVPFSGEIIRLIE